MTGLIWNLCFASLVLASYVTADPLEKCQARNSTFAVGDSEFCDKYYECGTSGKFNDRWCDDGFVFSVATKFCEYPYNVNCTERPNLQPPRSTNRQCPRMNGFYAFPPQESCQKFHHCLEGQAYEKTCPEGVIFDDTKGACVHPDMASRTECSASKVLDFVCPNAEKRFSKLRFGNHDRHAHPNDCRKFFICMQDGQPRIGGCPNGKVFNPKTGNCDLPKRVPNCKDYYLSKGSSTFVDEDGQELTLDELEESNKAEEESQQSKKQLNNSKKQ